jgi:cytochrome c oxidase subunit 2
VTAGVAVLVLGSLTLVAWWPRSAEAPASPVTVASGAQLFRAKGCVGCHDGPDAPSTVGVGPALIALRDRAGERVPGLGAEAYVRESVLDPQAYVVPGFGESFTRMPSLAVTEAELDALVAYLLGPSP